MEAKSNASFHYNYRLTGKPHADMAKSSNRGIDKPDRPTGYTNPSKARMNVRIPGTNKKAFD